MNTDKNQKDKGSMSSESNQEEINRLTEKIIARVYRVSNTLGSGFLEKVYENALAIELRNNGLKVEQQHPIKVVYDGQAVGDFAADLLVESCVIVELKAVRTLDDVHSALCLNYLKATGLKICLLVNFGRPRVEIKRLVL
jgi:GxxExxY protein